MYQNQNHTGCKNNNLVSATASNDVKSYLQFCTMFGLTQIVKSPTRITFSSTSLIDHILASLPDRISQEGVMNVGLSDHQLIYCIRKISRVKTRGVHKIIRFCSRKNYAVDAYKNALKKINFPNYEYFEDVNWAYPDFFQKLMTVTNNVAPCKTKRVKGNTQNWFDREVLQKLRSRDKLSKAFKKARLHIDKELYKKAKCIAQKLIAAKKQAFFDEKLSESVGKPKELWNTLKSLGMPKKTVVSNFNAIDDNKSLTYDMKTMSKVFKDFFSNLAKSFLDKLPDP